MAKSAGNFIRLQTLLDNGYDPLVYRYQCFSAHYRTKLTFTWESLDAAASGYDSLKDFVARAIQIGGEEQPWVAHYRLRFKTGFRTTSICHRRLECSGILSARPTSAGSMAFLMPFTTLTGCWG